MVIFSEPMAEKPENMENEELVDLEDETPEKTVYETGILLDGSLSDEDALTHHEAFKSALTERGALIIAEGTPESKKLAYTITIKRDAKRKDYSKAHFSWIKFDLASSDVAEFEKALRGDEKVIRYLLIKTVRENTLREPIEGLEDELDEDLEEGVVEDASAAPEAEEAPETEEEKVEV
jgi:ribosomal protein S6